MEDDTHTQFGYACHQLGILLETTSIPQAKGRVERLNQTLQSRLPIELEQNNIHTLEEANTFLLSYIQTFNEQFGNKTKLSVFEEVPNPLKGISFWLDWRRESSIVDTISDSKIVTISLPNKEKKSISSERRKH